MKTVKITLILVLVALVIGAGLVYGGVIDVAADTPHWALTNRLLSDARERSIARQAADVEVPARLSDPEWIASGAGEYAEMCSGCHLAPGMEDTEMRAGLYPKPPDFARGRAPRPAAQQFWIVKHGIKMTGMPGWGATHDDARLWSIVAFLQKLPGMSVADYRALIAVGGGGHHHHDDDDGDHREAAESEDQHSHDHAETSAPLSGANATLNGAARDAAAVVDDFQARLARGETDAAAKLLVPSLLVFESGEVEASRDEYASHHLKADAGFLKSAHVRPLARHGVAAGDVAWIATESEITSHGDKPVDLVSTETMVLERTPQGWRIAHIHWSSRKK